MKYERIFEIAHKLCGLVTDDGSAAQSLRISPVLVGVSGGPDSLCLLDCLVHLGFPVVAAHFDHRLRPDSGQDAERVRLFAGQLGVPFVLGSQDVGAFARQEQRSIEEAARILRYQFLFEQARLCHAQAVAVGHTADDQVETVLMHLLRGAGLTGLTGMAYHAILPEWDEHIPLVRPLLDFWRAETLAYCQEQALQPVFDPSNQETVYQRNRLRADLIPLIETFNPQARPAIWRMAELLRADAEIVQAATQQAWQACLWPVEQTVDGADLLITPTSLPSLPSPTANAPVVLRLSAFRALLPGLQRGVLRRAIAQLVSGHGPSGQASREVRDVDFAAIERGLAFANRPAPSGVVDLVDGLRLWVEGERLLIARAGELSANPDWPKIGSQPALLPVPGLLKLADGWCLHSEWLAWDGQTLSAVAEVARWQAWLDVSGLVAAQGTALQADAVLVVRPPRAGDRFQPLGMDGHSIKLSDFWINQKLARRARSGWPLVTLNESILWVPGYRPAHPWRVTEQTRQVLHLWLERGIIE